MPNLKTSSLGKSLVLLRSQLQPGHRTSLLFSNRLALPLLGPGNAPSKDPKGNALRKLRLEKGIDPAVLATQACISLGQLYAIETGVQDHFYTPVLREQTARRVARLLSADWDCIESLCTPSKPASNVIPLQRTNQAYGVASRVQPSPVTPLDITTPSCPAAQSVFVGLRTPSADANNNGLGFTPCAPSRPELSLHQNGSFLGISIFLVITAVFVFFFFDPAFVQAVKSISATLEQFFLAL